MTKTTPLESLHTQLGAEFTEYYGWTMPGSFSELNDELAGLENSSAAFDLCPFLRIAISGSDADIMIAAVFPDAGSISVNSWQWASQDKYIRVLRTANEYIAMVHPKVSEAVSERIRSIAARFNVNIADRTEKTAMIGIYGPDSYQSLGRIVPLDISQISEIGSILSVSFFMMNFTVVRGSWLGSDGVELICPVSAAKFATQAIEKYHKRENIIPAGVTCFDAAFEKYVFETI